MYTMTRRTSNGLKFEQLETETKNSRKNLVFKLEKKLENRMKNHLIVVVNLFNDNLMHAKKKKKKRIILDKYLKKFSKKRSSDEKAIKS